MNGLNSTDVKRLNRQTVLKYLAQNKGISRVELTAKTGLTKMTITNIITEFLEHNLICTQQSTEHYGAAIGRKPVCLSFSGASPVILGIWISRDYCSGIVTDLHLSTIGMHNVRLSGENKNSLEQKLVGLVEKLLDGVNRPVVGIGVSSIGPLDLEKGVLLKVPNFYHITNFPVKDLLQKRFGLPVFLQNDMNAAALAEKYFGICREVANFVYVGLSNGVGSGVVVNDRLFDGASGYAGEVGHIVIDYHGELCQCGNRGCLETYISVPNLIKSFEETFHRRFEDFALLCDFCSRDPAGAQWMRERMELFSIGLANLCNIIDPDILVLGHEGALLDRDMLRYLEESINRKVLASGFANIRVVPSSFSTLAPLLGASVIILEKLFQGKLTLY